MAARDTQPSDAPRVGSGERRVGERDAAAAEPDASEYRLSSTLFTPLLAVEEELVNLIEAYSACLDSLGACGTALRGAAGNWSVESRDQNKPPPAAYWRDLLEDVRGIKLDDLRTAVQALPQYHDEVPHLIVDEVGRLLDEARTLAGAERSNDQVDYRRAERVYRSLLDAEEALVRLAHKITKRAVKRGEAVQSAVIEIFKAIKRQKDEEFVSSEQHRGPGSGAHFSTMRSFHKRADRRRGRSG